MRCPQQVAAAIRLLEEQGFEAYAVGGCVRDSLLGLVPHDWDICTAALTEEMKTVFAGFRLIETGIAHGTLTVLLDGLPLEITTYRVDGPYSDPPPPARRPFHLLPGRRPGPPRFYRQRHGLASGAGAAGSLRGKSRSRKSAC